MAKRSPSGRAGTVDPRRVASVRPAKSSPAPQPAESRPLAGLIDRLARPAGYAVGAAVMIALAVWARLATWSWIFGTGRTELLPSDSHYYVRLARLHLHAHGLVPFDPFVGFPKGSENYWPHLHTLLVATAAAVAPDPETGAAFVGPVATFVWLVLIAWAAYRALGGPRALVGLFLLALTPIAVEAGKIGNADHNVHEPMIAALVVMLAISTARGSTAAAVGAGLTAGLARLFTTSGFVFPGALALSLGAAFVATDPRAGDARAALVRRTAIAGTVCVAVLALALVLLGHPARLDYEALTLFHPLFAAALFGWVVALCALLQGRRDLAAAGAVCGLALAPLVPQLLVAAGHLARRDPLLAVVAESQPLLTRPIYALLLFGPALIALPFAFVGAARPVLSRNAPELAVPVLSGAVFFLAAAAQSRFGPLLIGAMAALVPVGLALALGSLGRVAARRSYVLAAVGFAVLGVMLVPPAPPPDPPPAALIRPTLLWMRDNLPPAAPDPWDWRAKPTYGVLAPFDYGHYVTLYAERPVLASPFSQTDAHVEANRVASEILSDTDEERAYQRVRSLGLRYILAAPSDLFTAGPLPKEALLQKLLRREPFGRFEPLYVSTEKRRDGGRYATVFEVVEGAVLTGSAPAGSVVQADFGDGYVRSSPTDPSGTFRVRLARPGVFAVSALGPRAGERVGPVPVTVTDEQIRAGTEIRVGDRR
jgi:dolichyl-diphosphooligosaccharide--protein glycosyltransferase